MKRSRNGVSVVVLSALMAGALAFTAPSRTIAQDAAPAAANAPQALAEKLIGTWKLEEASTPGSPSGVGTRLKLFTGTHWCVIQPNPDSGEIVFLHGGTYQVAGDQVTTKTDFAGERTKGMIGGSGVVTLKVDGDTMIQIDPKGVFNETWKRVK